MTPSTHHQSSPPFSPSTREDGDATGRKRVINKQKKKKQKKKNAATHKTPSNEA
jgi:hypothetical protein